MSLEKITPAGGQGLSARQMRWIALLLFPPIMWVGSLGGLTLPQIYFHEQDVWVLAVLMPLLPLVYHFRLRLALPDARLTHGRVALAGLALALLLWGGTYWLMADYPLTRDEDMVVFDMAVFAGGHLAQPLAPEWRAYAEALVPAFLMEIAGYQALVSAYMPGNAALRLAFSYIADPALMNPLLIMVGGVALFDIARRLFGDDRRAILVALILYALSAQMLVNAMTVYAMTWHLALNLIWLAAFLRGGRIGHAVALVAGVVAIGLHQVVFHPLFAGPFLLWALARGQWRIFALYAFVYGAALLGWTLYPALVTFMAGVPAQGAGRSDSFLVDRVLPLLLERDPATIGYTVLNLLRFVAWQHLALLPLMVASWPLVRANRSIAAPMMGGIILLILFFCLVLPYQGHGWGYRYLHGFLGSAALLGAMGYRQIAAQDRAKADWLVASLSLVTALVAIPWLLWCSASFVRPYAEFDKVAAAQTSDFVLIDTHWPSSGVDVVRNRPDLSNRPIRISSRVLTPSQLAELCRRGTITPLTRADMHKVGLSIHVSPVNPAFNRLMATLGKADCLKPPVAVR